MRGQILSKNSKYVGLLCQMCSQKLKPGQAAVTHTLYLALDARRPSPSIHLYRARPQRSINVTGETRLGWHTQCLRGIMDKAPLDEDTAERLISDHRRKILERERL